MTSSQLTEYEEELPIPIPFTFLTSAAGNVFQIYSKASFYRTVFNTNIEINIPIGNNYSPSLWYSLDTYLPENIFNSTKPTTEISFPFLNSIQIHESMKFYHDFQVDFKITKNNTGDGYENLRKLQCIFVNSANHPYDNSMIAYKQPGPNNRDILMIQGEINHNMGDIIKPKFNIIQDNFNLGQSNTTLIIYRITWNICGLKVI